MRRDASPCCLAAALVLLCPAAARAAVIEKTFTFPRPTLSQAGDFHSIELEGGHKRYEAVGLPLLPVKTASFLIPRTDIIERVEVIPAGKTPLGRGIQIDFGRRPQPISMPSPDDTKPDPAVYALNRPYLEDVLHSNAGVSSLAGYRIVSLFLHPVEYVPEPGAVSYYQSMTVRVVTKAGPALPREAAFRGLPADKRRAAALVLNPSAAENYGAAVAPTAESSAGGHYVIVTSNALKPAFEKLAYWKRETGLTTHIETVESIESAYGGKDTQEKIRSFIKHAYENWGTLYVVLGGDVDIIPQRNARAGSEDIPCDMYYGALDGDWDADGDGVYGEASTSSTDTAQGGLAGEEADFMAEVMVGRISAGASEEATRQIDKIIAFERGTKKQNALLIGEKLSSTFYASEIKDYASEPFPAAWRKDTLYTSETNKITADDVIAGLNSDEYQIINHMGHSNITYNMGLSNTTVSKITATKPFVIYTAGCLPNAFDSADSISEYHTVKNANGAFAFIGNSRYGWFVPGQSNTYSAAFDRTFFEAVFTEGQREVGRALQKSKEMLVDSARGSSYYRWTYYALNLLGCPQTRLDETPSWSAPGAVAAVNDGEADDADYSASKTRLAANWTASEDAESGIARYWYAVGTTPGGTDVADWTDNGAATAAARTGLSLSNKQRYYFSVKAENGAGLHSAVQTSDGQTVDAKDPTVAIRSPDDGTTQAGGITVKAAADDNVGIKKVVFTIDDVKETVTEAPYSFTLNTRNVFDGARELKAKAVDKAGNSAAATVTITIANSVSGTDNTNPKVRVRSPADGETVAGTVKLRAQAWDNESVTKVKFYVDGAHVGTVKYGGSRRFVHELDTRTLGDGERVVKAEAYDAAGNTRKDSVSVTVANSGQGAARLALSVNGLTDAQRVSGTAEIGVSGLSGARFEKIELYLDGELLQTAGADARAFTLDTSGHDDDWYVLTVKAYDAFGNVAVGHLELTNSAGVDATPPTVSITSPSGGATVAGTIDVAASASDDTGVAKVEFYVDGTLKTADASSPYSFTLDTTGLADGAHTLKAKAHDAAGNASESSITVTVNNGTTDPPRAAPTITRHPASIEAAEGESVTFSVVAEGTEPLRYQWYHASQGIQGAESSEYVHPRASRDDDGTDFQVRVWNDYGFVESQKAVLTVRTGADTEPPTVSFASPRAGETISGVATLSVTATDGVGVAKVEFYVDGALKAADSSSPYSFTLDTMGLADGAHILKAMAYDAAGNSAEASVAVTVKNSADGGTDDSYVSLIYPRADANVSGLVRIRAWVADSYLASKVDFYVDDVLQTTDLVPPYAYTLDTSALADGGHVLRAKAYDAAGGAAESSISVSVDNADAGSGGKASSVFITYPRDGSSAAGTVRVRAAASASAGGIEFYVDGGLLATDESVPFAFTLDTESLADGPHTVAVKAVGETGSEDSITITVANGGSEGGADTVAPSVYVVYPKAGRDIWGKVRVRAAADDDAGVAKVEFYVDGALVLTDASSPYAFTLDTAQLANDACVIAAKAYDAAGNAAEHSVEANVYNAGNAALVALAGPAGDFAAAAPDGDPLRPSLAMGPAGGSLDSDLARILVPAGALFGEIEVGLAPAITASSGPGIAAAREAGLIPMSDGVSLLPADTRTSVSAAVEVVLSTRTGAAPSAAARELAVFAWDASARTWRPLPTVLSEDGGVARAQLSRFTEVQVFAYAPASSSSGTGEVFVFPNPAKGGTRPTFHIASDRAQEYRLRIFNFAGESVHEASVSGAPALVDRGEGLRSAYEYTWDAAGAGSGVYFYTVSGADGGGRKAGKFALLK